MQADYLWQNSRFTGAGYARLLNCAKATRSLDFRRQLDMEILEWFGKGKSTHYKLKG